MNISELTSAREAEWDDYVASHQDATFFHLTGWSRVLARSFGHKTHFLFAEKNGTLVGILPLAEVKSLLFGHSLAALPFCVYGGIVADDDEAAAALRDHACRLADSIGVDAMELRNYSATSSGWPAKDLYFTFKKDIDSDHDVNMKAIPNKQRAMVRKGIKAGLVGELTSDVDRLYRVYSESVRNLGTPVFAKRYLEILLEEFADYCDILMISDQSGDVAGVMNFWFKGEVLPYYGGSVSRARSIKGSNDFMYWELMRHACDRGYHTFDFGRSKRDTGPYKFKKNWGFTPTPLNYEYYLVNSETVPEVNPTNPKYRLLIDTWKKLPLPVANFIGPFLAKDLG